MDERELIKERIPIVDIVSESIPLKKAGRNFKGLCPFHTERTPSFVVSPDRNIWHCFGCGKGGDIFTFLMEIDRLEFPEALKILAARAGVTLQTRTATSKNQELKENLLSLHQLTAEFYHFLLTKHRLGERARSYLHERGITKELIQTFGLGFAPQSWNNLSKFLAKKKIALEILQKSGLVLTGKMGLYDRFRARIIFPIRNYRGETIAFSGRVLQSNEKEAKYINSPETPLYTKGETVYGIDVTKEALRKTGNAIVVEGEFDVISSFHAGITNVVAIKGSALTEAQIRLIKRFSERMTLSLDQDLAGDAASRRGILLAEKAGLDIRVVTSLSGKDPDEVARNEPYLWKQAVKNAVPYYEFLISSACTRFNPAEAFGKKKISDEVLPVLVGIENPIVQSHYISLLAKRLLVPEEKIMQALLKLQATKGTVLEKNTPVTQVDVYSHEEHLEEHLLALVLQSQQGTHTLEKIAERLDPSDFRHPVVQKIFIALLEMLMEFPKLQDFTEGIKKLPAELTATVNRLLLLDLTPFLSAEVFTKELDKTITAIAKSVVRRNIADLSQRLSQAQKSGNKELFTALYAQLRQLTAHLKKLA